MLQAPPVPGVARRGSFKRFFSFLRRNCSLIVPNLRGGARQCVPPVVRTWRRRSVSSAIDKRRPSRVARRRTICGKTPAERRATRFLYPIFRSGRHGRPRRLLQPTSTIYGRRGAANGRFRFPVVRRPSVTFACSNLYARRNGRFPDRVLLKDDSSTRAFRLFRHSSRNRVLFDPGNSSRSTRPTFSLPSCSRQPRVYIMYTR